MVGASSVELPGEGSAAGSAKQEESKRVEKASSRKRQTPRSNAAAEARGPGDQRKKEEKRGGKSTERERLEKSGQSRSRRSSSSAAPADETKRADEPSALPSSPSTARSTTVKAEGEYGQKKKKERRRRSDESPSSVSSRAPTVRKSSKDGSNRRQRSSQSPSSDITLVEAKAREATAAPASRAPSSAKGPKRRKRSSSSKAVLVNGDYDKDNEREEPPRIQQTTVPSGMTDVERVATPPSSGTGSKDTRSHAVAAPCYDIPTAAVEANNRKECALEDKPPVTPLADTEAEYNELPAEGSTIATQSKNGILRTELSCVHAGAEGSAPEGGVRLGRDEGSAGRRGEEAAQESVPATSKRAGTDDALSRSRRRSTTEERPRRPRVATEPSPSTALGVKVIDEGDTKHLVLTAGQTTAGEGKSGSGSDRSRGGTSSSRRRNRGGSRSSPAQHVHVYSQRQERRAEKFRENFETTVPARGGDIENPTPQRSEYLTDAFEQTTVVRDDVVGRVASQAPQAERSKVEEKQQSEPTNDHHPDHPLMFSREVETPACKAPSCPASPSKSSSCMAPSFSITTNGSTNDHARESGTPPPYNKRPSLHHATPLPDTRIPGNGPRGTQSSPTSSTTSSSSSSSPLRGRPVSDRTAKYVTHQASFHTDISDHYVDLNSPLGTVRGERGTGGEESKMGVATSSPPAEKSIHRDNAPVVSSSRPPPDMVWETSTRDGHQKVSCGAAPESTMGKTEEVFASSLTPSAAIPVGSLAGGDGNAHSDSNQPGRAVRDVTQDRLADGSEEDADGSARDLLHFRTDAPRHLVCGGRPELFFLRPNESLAVTRIEGSGRLLVTVREEAGAAAVVVVDRAIVHDSAAHFGHAAVQTDHRFPYVAGHRYEFQVEAAQGVELAVRGGGDENRQATPSSQGSKTEHATGLHVVFSVTSAYTKGARLCHKDAARSSLPTFEAPPAYKFQQPKEPRQSSAAATASAPSSAAERNPNTQSAPEQKPTCADVRRSPSPSVAAELRHPCVSPPPPGTDNLAALRASTETSEPTPGAPAPPAPVAAAKAPAGTSPNRMVARGDGGTAEGFAQGEPPQNTTSEDQARVAEINGQFWPESGVESERRDGRERNTIGGEQDLRERSSPVHARAGERNPRSFMPASPAMYPYNAQQYRERVPEGATVMMEGDQPSAGGLKWNPAWEQHRLPTLPYIRRHVDHISPRSAFEQQSPSGGAGSFATRDSSVAGVDRLARPPGYFVQEPPIRRKRQAETSRTEDESHTGYHPPARERTLHGRPPRVYHPGYASDVHSSVAIEREHHMPPDTTSAGGGSHWGERRDDREQPRASNHRSRWREDGDEGWARKSERNAYLPAGHAYQPGTGRGHNRQEDPRRYQSDYDGGIYKASSLSDSSRRGYKYGNGIPPSGKETAKMVGTGGGGGGGGVASSDPSRGRAFARGGAVMGMGRRGEQRGVELTGHGDYHIGNGGYSERLIDSQARRGVDSIASRESKERRKRTPRTHGDDVAYRKSRHSSTGAVHQTGSTVERVPPRWIKF